MRKLLLFLSALLMVCINSSAAYLVLEKPADNWSVVRIYWWGDNCATPGGQSWSEWGNDGDLNDGKGGPNLLAKEYDTKWVYGIDGKVYMVMPIDDATTNFVVNKRVNNDGDLEFDSNYIYYLNDKSKYYKSSTKVSDILSAPENVSLGGSVWQYDDNYKFENKGNGIFETTVNLDGNWCIYLPNNTRFRVDGNATTYGSFNAVPTNYETPSTTLNAKITFDWNNGNPTIKLSEPDQVVTPDPVEVDYTKWYVNIGSFNGSDPSKEDFFKGVQCDENGIARFENIALGSFAFQIKVWDGKPDTSGDHYYSAASIAVGTATVCDAKDQADNSSINAGTVAPGTFDNGVYNIEYNVVTNTILLTQVLSEEPGETENTHSVGFFNEANWENVYAYVWDENGTEYLNEWPGTLLSKNEGDGKYVCTFKTSNTPEHFYVIFNGGKDQPQTKDFEWTDNATYKNEAVDENDRSEWWVKIGSDIWKDADGNGYWKEKQPGNKEGIVEFKDLPLSNWEFKISYYNKITDLYYYAKDIVLDTPTVCTEDAQALTSNIKGAAEGDKFNVTYNCSTNTITVTKVVDNPVEPVYPEGIKLMSNVLSGDNWTYGNENNPAFEANEGIYTLKNVTITENTSDNNGNWFAFITSDGKRYMAQTDDNCMQPATSETFNLVETNNGSEGNANHMNIDFRGSIVIDWTKSTPTVTFNVKPEDIHGTFSGCAEQARLGETDKISYPYVINWTGKWNDDNTVTLSWTQKFTDGEPWGMPTNMLVYGSVDETRLEPVDGVYTYTSSKTFNPNDNFNFWLKHEFGNGASQDNVINGKWENHVEAGFYHEDGHHRMLSVGNKEGEPAEAIKIRHIAMFGGENGSIEEHYNKVNVSITPAATYANFITQPAEDAEDKDHFYNKNASIVGFAGINDSSEASSVEVLAHTAGIYNLVFEQTDELDGLKPSKVTIPVRVSPSIRGIGLAINWSYVEFGDENVLHYIPDYKLEDKDPANNIVWTAEKAIMSAYDATNDENLEIWWNYGKSIEPISDAKLIGRRAPSALTSAEEQNVIPEGFTKFDGTLTAPNLNLAADNGLQVVVKQNGIVGPVEDITVKANTTGEDPTGVEAVEAAEDAEAVYYTLDGIRVDNPEKGLYIVVKGGNAAKVYKTL